LALTGKPLSNIVLLVLPPGFFIVMYNLSPGYCMGCSPTMGHQCSPAPSSCRSSGNSD
jgi:hypothetical protein